MRFWKRLFGREKLPTEGVARMNSFQEPVVQMSSVSLETTDVEALAEAAYHAGKFIQRHSLVGMYGDLGGTDIYRVRVVSAFMLAADKILPPEEVVAIFESSFTPTNEPWSDRVMCSVFLPLLDQAMGVIGADNFEVMPLIYFKVDLQKFSEK